jgi:hypothetical protein
MKSERYTRTIIELANKRKRASADGEDAYADTHAFNRRASTKVDVLS